MKSYQVTLTYSNNITERVTVQCITTRDIVDKARTQAGIRGVTGEVTEIHIKLMDKLGESNE